MEKQLYPILEFDSTEESVIEPSKVIGNIDAPKRCVVCFFQDVISKVCKEKNAKVISTLRSEQGTHPVYEISVDDERLAFFHPGVGAPNAVGFLEEVIALGCRKFIACGGAGVLVRDIDVGKIIIPTSALRDEGTSYHYLPPSRDVEACREAVSAIERVLKRDNCQYILAKTWTTDAYYRETPRKVKCRKDEGCVTVEMEAAAFFAAASFRKVQFAQMLYAGDDLSGEKWNSRLWQHNSGSTREKLFWLAAESCLEL